MDVAIFGNIVADVIGTPIDLRDPPPPASLRFIDSITLATGGVVCNVGIALAKLGLSAAGCGLVGDDILGRALLERLKIAGVDASSIFTSDRAQTSATIAAVESGSGERTFFHASGITGHLNADAFRKCFGVFRQCSWVHIAYFGLLPAITADLPQLLVELKQTAPNTKVSLDTLDPPAEWKLLEPILPHLDLFCPSRPDAKALCGKSKPEAMVAFFRKHMPQGIIGIKLDADGCYLDDGKDSIRALGNKVKVVDTTGAGDCWFAGLLTGLRHNYSLMQCAQLANRVGADCCTAIGASAGVQSLPETLKRMPGAESLH